MDLQMGLKKRELMNRELTGGQFTAAQGDNKQTLSGYPVRGRLSKGSVMLILKYACTLMDAAVCPYSFFILYIFLHIHWKLTDTDETE